MLNKSKGGGIFKVTCHDAQGNLKWETESHNLVVDEGLYYMNEAALGGGSQSTVWYIGLYGAASSNNPAASDTMSSHAGWTEIYTEYTQTTRPACTFATATIPTPGTSEITNTASKAAFNFSASATVGGAFLTSDNTKGGTSGTLFSAADFASPGDRTVANGDQLNVEYTFSLDAA